MRKYIIGYNDNTISPLQLFLPKMTDYLNIFEDGARKMMSRCLGARCLFLLLIMNF